jgi:hypothetical protein
VVSSASLALPYANTELRSGWYASNPRELNSPVGRLRYIPTRLSAAEIQALTS